MLTSTIPCTWLKGHGIIHNELFRDSRSRTPLPAFATMKQKTMMEYGGPPSFWCSVCCPEEPETHSRVPWGLLTLPSEPAMNAAGRTSDHPFKDMRSARHAHQRTKKYPERMYPGNRLRRSDRYRPAHAVRLARLDDAYAEIERGEWEMDTYDELAWAVDLENLDDVIAYNRHGKNAHIFESADPSSLYSAEDFGAWARRRISEMRLVKEHRLLKYGRYTSPTQPEKVFNHSMQYTSRPGRIRATIPTAPFSNPHETTLPTTSSDVRAHATLRCVLTPSKYFIWDCRRRHIPPFPVIDGLAWFGEYTWQWHRNLSGCWELGYANEACEGGAGVPCSCPCNGSVTYRCYCAEFGVGTKWEVPAPEEPQACSLVEWVAGESRGLMKRDERLSWNEGRLRGSRDGCAWEQSTASERNEFENESDSSWEDGYVMLQPEGSDSSWSVVSNLNSPSGE